MSDRRFAKTVLVIFLVSFALGPVFSPTRTNADVQSDAKIIAKCTAAGLIGSGVSYLIGLLLANLTQVPVNDPQNNAKELVTDVLARCWARQILDSSIGGMLNIVRTQGRDGGKSYVQNWRNFQTNAQYRGEAVFRGILANTQVCDFLRKDIDKTFRVRASDKISLKGQNTRIGDMDPFTVRGMCTLPSGFNLQNYARNFSGNGGWGTFLRMLEPQNNYFGLVLQSINEADKQKAMEISSDLYDAQTGRGYTALRGTGSASCRVRGANGICIVYNNITSPGSYVADTVAATIQSELGWITSVDELNEVIAAYITERLMARLQNLGSNEGAPVYTSQPSPPPVCRDPAQPIPTPEPPFIPGQTPRTDRQIRLNSQIAQIHDALQSLSNNARMMTSFLDQRKNVLIAGRKTQRELDLNKQSILGLIDAPQQSQALDLLSEFDRLARELYLGEGQASTTVLPACSTPPPIPTPVSTPVPTPGTDNCYIPASRSEFRHIDDVQAAQDRVAARAQAGGDVGLNPSDTTIITDFNKYHGAVVTELNGAGFPLAFHDGEEIQICRTGDGFSEHADISTSSSRVRSASNFDTTICRPAAVTACN